MPKFVQKYASTPSTGDTVLTYADQEILGNKTFYGNTQISGSLILPDRFEAVSTNDLDLVSGYIDSRLQTVEADPREEITSMAIPSGADGADIVFPEPYQSTPTVFVSFRSDAAAASKFYATNVFDVTNSGFGVLFSADVQEDGHFLDISIKTQE